MDLKMARENAGITQGQLAQQTGILQTNISLQENGGRHLAMDEMLLCERALNAPIEWTDRFNAKDKGDIFRAMATLSEHFPVLTVLEFVKRTLLDRLDAAPVKKLKFVAGVAQGAQPGSLLPPGVEEQKGGGK